VEVIFLVGGAENPRLYLQAGYPCFVEFFNRQLFVDMVFLCKKVFNLMLNLDTKNKNYF